MLNTTRNVGYAASMAVFFSILIYGLSVYLPGSISTSLSMLDAKTLTPFLEVMPPAVALFSAFLGINPVPEFLLRIPSGTIANVSNNSISTLSGSMWFPHVLAPAFGDSFALVFYVAASITVIAAILSVLRRTDIKEEVDNVRKSDEGN
ncbi:MAG: hypothetical protein ACP5UZ_04330 [Thermoplasmata archaeon]